MPPKGKGKKGGKSKEVVVEEPAAAAVFSPRTVTGTLSSHPLSRDVRPSAACARLFESIASTLLTRLCSSSLTASRFLSTEQS